MNLLDTTVLVYARGGDHPLQPPATALLRAIGDGTVRATTTVGVLQEFTHVRARRRGRQDAASLARDLATALAPLTTATSDDLLAGLDHFLGHDGLGAFDAVLLAVSLHRGARIVSADRAIVDAAGARGLHLGAPDLLERAAS